MSDVRVFIAHVDPSERRDIRRMVERATGVEVVGDAEPDRGGMERIVSADPDVVVLKVPTSQEAIDLCRQMLDANPRIRCLVLASWPDDEAFVQAVLIGATGMVRRERLLEDLRDSTTTTLPERARELLERHRPDEAIDLVAGLSEQEREVAYRVVSGATNGQIAAELGLSPHTVRNYIHRITSRIGARNRTELAVALAAALLQLGRIDPARRTGG